MVKKSIKFQGISDACVGRGEEGKEERSSFFISTLIFNQHHKGDPSRRHHTVMEAKLSKVSPPLPSEEGGALPGTNSSSTDPEVYVSLFHMLQTYWSALGRKARCIKS